MRKKFAGLVAPLLAGALLLAGCTSTTNTDTSSASGSTAAMSTTKDTLTLGATLDMYGWDPLNQPGYQNWAADAVWQHIARCDAVGALQPDAAESWEISDANKTITCHCGRVSHFPTVLHSMQMLSSPI